MPPKVWKPEEYDRQCVLQYNTAMTMLDSLTLEGDEKILDVGCGTGRITEQIAIKRLIKGSILGLDVNERMVAFAKEKYRTINLSFECQDVLTMDHEDCFDIVVSFWTLSWIPMEEQLTALTNIIHSLNESGRLFLMYPLKHDAYEVVTAVTKRPEWQKYFETYTMPRAFITAEQYKAILEQIPMEIHVEQKEIECCYKDDQEMIASINCWLAHVDEIPNEEDKNKFLMAVVAAYKEFRKITEPTMYYSTLEITGNKNTFEYQNTCRL